MSFNGPVNIQVDGAREDPRAQYLIAQGRRMLGVLDVLARANPKQAAVARQWGNEEIGYVKATWTPNVKTVYVLVPENVAAVEGGRRNREPRIEYRDIKRTCVNGLFFAQGEEDLVYPCYGSNSPPPASISSVDDLVRPPEDGGNPPALHAPADASVLLLREGNGAVSMLTGENKVFCLEEKGHPQTPRRNTTTAPRALYFGERVGIAPVGDGVRVELSELRSLGDILTSTARLHEQEFRFVAGRRLPLVGGTLVEFRSNQIPVVYDSNDTEEFIDRTFPKVPTVIDAEWWYYGGVYRSCNSEGSVYSRFGQEAKGSLNQGRRNNINFAAGYRWQTAKSCALRLDSELVSSIEYFKVAARVGIGPEEVPEEGEEPRPPGEENFIYEVPHALITRTTLVIEPDGVGEQVAAVVSVSVDDSRVRVNYAHYVDIAETAQDVAGAGTPGNVLQYEFVEPAHRHEYDYAYMYEVMRFDRVNNEPFEQYYDVIHAYPYSTCFDSVSYVRYYSIEDEYVDMHLMCVQDIRRLAYEPFTRNIAAYVDLPSGGRASITGVLSFQYEDNQNKGYTYEVNGEYSGDYDPFLQRWTMNFVGTADWTHDWTGSIDTGYTFSGELTLPDDVSGVDIVLPVEVAQDAAWSVEYNNSYATTNNGSNQTLVPSTAPDFTYSRNVTLPSVSVGGVIIGGGAGNAFPVDGFSETIFGPHASVKNGFVFCPLAMGFKWSVEDLGTHYLVRMFGGDFFQKQVNGATVQVCTRASSFVVLKGEPKGSRVVPVNLGYDERMNIEDSTPTDTYAVVYNPDTGDAAEIKRGSNGEVPLVAPLYVSSKTKYAKTVGRVPVRYWETDSD